MSDQRFKLECRVCGTTFPADYEKHECPEGHPLTLTWRDGPPRFAGLQAAPGKGALWAYGYYLPAWAPGATVSLGEGGTPWVDITGAALGVGGGRHQDAGGHGGTTDTGPKCLAKVEFLSPTGSFKDRGAATMVSRMREIGVNRAVEDSSGNAGAAVAAYCGAAGIHCDIYVPASASAGKLVQVERYGSHLVRVPGTREDTTRAAVEAAVGTYYASHNRHPYFLVGMKTYAYELYASLGDQVTDLLFPTGGGSLLLGAFYGYRDLVAAGHLASVPRLWAVQTQSCAPLAEAWARGCKEPVQIEKRPTVAEGIAVASPPRGAEILLALRESGGGALTVGEEEIMDGYHTLARAGLYAETTTGTVLAGFRRLAAGGRLGAGTVAVIPLTGSGLKASG